MSRFHRTASLLVAISLAATAAYAQQTLPGTEPLTWSDDIASRMIDGIDRFLLAETAQSLERSGRFWQRDFSSLERYQASVAPNRERLAHILGLRDKRVPYQAPQVLHAPGAPSRIATGDGYSAYQVRWPVLEGVDGEGLLLVPEEKTVRAFIVAIPDADQTPEQLIGLQPGVAAESQFARRLAENGCQVLIPTLISREVAKRSPPGMPERGHALTTREFLYRPSFVLGRHLIGYELQKILAAVDWFAQARSNPDIGVMGWGEGGLLAFYAAALDTRIDAACVSGYFDDRRSLWQQPIERNVFGLLQQFADADVASLIAPRRLIVEACNSPHVRIDQPGAGPGVLNTPEIRSVQVEFTRAKNLIAPLKRDDHLSLVMSGDGTGPYGSPQALEDLLQALIPEADLASLAEPPQRTSAHLIDPRERQQRQARQIEQHTQQVLEESPAVRSAFMKKLDVKTAAGYESSTREYRQLFYEDVIGRFEHSMLPAKPRTRQTYDKDRWTGYEVVLDVFPDVIAYGILLLPKDLKADEKRPVVVCQHGLEGRPQDIVQGDHPAYHDFAAKLAERGFIVFAPQNPYIFKDRFRTLQRKANPLKKTLFSIVTPQHQQILNWLKTLPNVDGTRIGFYGLSYGGKTAMRVPALLTDYCLSICSADFNDWVWKNANTHSPYSYVWTNEYEIFEFDLGATFNYAEMAALIAPRPFMVERGHFDNVAPDERVAYEFAKVRHLYQAKLGLKDRAEIEWFVGPHTIHGQGTFDFLHHHLDWPKPTTR